MSVTKRLYFLDNLRVALIILVIAHHVGQAYGPTGGAWPIGEPIRAALLGPFFTVNRSFFMSLFFMISGYFVVMAYDAKGPIAFVKSRALRLGIPVLVFGLLMIPVQMFMFKPAGQSGLVWPPFDVGHLWFLEHLLIFSAGYALWRWIRRNQVQASQIEAGAPGYMSILAFALLLAVVTGIVRIWYPIDRWLYLLGFIKVAFADVPRDLSFFVIGLMAYRRQWFLNFPTRAGMVWLAVGVGGSLFWVAYDFWLRSALRIDAIGNDFVRLVWEAVFCCGMCIGLTVLFRETLNLQNRLSKALAQSQYAAYIFHVPIIIGIQFAVAGVAAPPLAKFVVVTLVGVPLTFLISSWVRRPLRI
jgi:glucans biosynthesis protein C